MTLLDMVKTLDELDDDSTIYAVEPWLDGSEATLVPNYSTNDQIDYHRADAKRYFLEVSVAKEVRDGQFLHCPETSIEELCSRIIYYAIFDA